jgi:serine O-acetyltransferase
MSPSVFGNWMRHALASAFGEASHDAIDKSVNLMNAVRELIRSDFLRANHPAMWDDEERCRHLLLTSAPWQATLLYRVSHALFLTAPEDPLLDMLSYVMRTRTGIEVYYSSTIGEGFRIMHGEGLVLGPRNRIGKNFTVYQGVTLGQRRQNSPEESLEIGDDCIFFAGARILGKLKIGNDVKVAANAVLLCDAEDGATYGGIPAKRI